MSNYNYLIYVILNNSYKLSLLLVSMLI